MLYQALLNHASGNKQHVSISIPSQITNYLKISLEVFSGRIKPQKNPICQLVYNEGFEIVLTI
jgi:hypothetical protein